MLSNRWVMFGNHAVINSEMLVRDQETNNLLASIVHEKSVY